MAAIGLVEEMLPVVGILPTATLAWVKEMGGLVLGRLAPKLEVLERSQSSLNNEKKGK